MRKIITLALIVLGFNQTILSQNIKQNFGAILTTYYLEKDDDLIEKSIDFFNHINPNDTHIPQIIVGFYGGLFLKSPKIKKEFKLNLERFENDNIRNSFNALFNNDIEVIMFEYPISPAFNDMNWAAFFSTGDTKYLDKILKISLESNNRVDRNLFLAGATAKWSLCSNSLTHDKVKEYLESNITYKESARKILNSNPPDLYENVAKVLKEQKSKGIWN